MPLTVFQPAPAAPKFAARLTFTLREEGGYVDDPDDPGGVTDWGITLAAWRAYVGDPEADPDDLRAITPEERAAFYGAACWNPVRGEDLPAGVDLMAFDHAVNAGVCRSAMLVQQALDVAQDGHIGPQTLAAARRVAGAALVARLDQLQGQFYRTRPKFARYGAGWLARLARRTAAARALAAPATTEA